MVIKNSQPEFKPAETPAETGRLDNLVRRGQKALNERKPLNDALSEEELETLRSRYSHFEDQRDDSGFLVGGSHLITRITTPRPYLHLISSNHSREYGVLGSFWDQTGGGFSSLDSVLAGAVTSHKDNSYVPTVPRATDHRHFYLRECSLSGKPPLIWHLFPQFGLEEEAYAGFHCAQGLGTHTIAAGRNGISAELLAFVPMDDPIEVWRLKIINNGASPRTLDLFLSVNWGLESYPGYYFDPRVVSLGRCYEELNALVALNRDQNNKHPRTGFLMSEERFESFDMAGEEFYGPGHFRQFPKAVEQGACCGSLGVQPCLGLISAMHFRLDLKAGKEKNLHFLLGVTEPDPAKGKLHLSSLRKAYFEKNGIWKALSALEGSWRMMIDRHKVRSPDKEIDRFFNVWSKYQAKNTARWTRALDKVGYRDVLQDLMGINTFNPEYTAAMLPTVLRHQFRDGRAIRQFAKFRGAPHDMRMYMDSSSWITDTLVDYVQETGDFEILDREEGFLNPQTGQVYTNNKATLYEHALLGLRALYENRGLHGLCRIGHGDWNDSLDGVGQGGEGVSVWLSMALIYAARRFRELAAYLGDKENARLMDKIIHEMTEAVNSSAWDGAHYVYAFMADGTPVGSNKSPEGKIHLNVNTWSLFNGVAQKGGHTQQVLESIAKLKTPLGCLLLYPAYTEKSRSVGRIADIVPGQFENGSIYTHGQSFLIYALTALGKGDEALREMKKILPEATLPDISTGPLHQISNYTVGIEHEHFGRNLYSNFCGALSWLRKALARMFGLLPDFDRLVIDPSVPTAWREYESVKVFRGCRVEVHFSNPRALSRGVAQAKLDGVDLPLEGEKAFIPLELIKGRDRVTVDVVLGRSKDKLTNEI
ncbi:MAG TPA: hypothetical protein VM123_07290 [archaeon]|nr:hypothetical protein [archaeon]